MEIREVGKERVIVYIDGYNLFYGLKDSGFKRYYWLNIQALVNKIIKPNQELVKIKYFTTLVTNHSDTRMRQKAYIGALETLDKVQIYYGKFQKETNHCNHCGNNYNSDCEKMTDVGIATQIMCDFYEDKFDMAMIISGDTDLLPPIRFVNDSKHKRAFIAFPPNRVNEEVRKFSKGEWVIGRKNIADCQFPDQVVNANGLIFERPKTWV